MLVYDEGERISMRHIFNEPYFKNEKQNYWFNKNIQKNRDHSADIILNKEEPKKLRTEKVNKLDLLLSKEE